MTSRKPESVLITGASGALGAEVARRFASAGVRVFGTFLDGAVPELMGAQVDWIEVNLADPVQVRQRLAGLQVDALVHCAGGFRFANVDQVSDPDLDFLFDANLKSSFLVTRQLLPGMKERNFGRIVYIGARATVAASGGMGPYTASKAGINMLTSAVADEVKRFDINVNAVLPSIIDTPANRGDMPMADFSSWVSVESLAEIIFSLTQPWGKPIHGALIPVSGRA